jgi:hypothetical protein
MALLDYEAGAARIVQRKYKIAPWSDSISLSGVVRLEIEESQLRWRLAQLRKLSSTVPL